MARLLATRMRPKWGPSRQPGGRLEFNSPASHHRDLIVRVAGYSDYFCDLPWILQEEIIQRTEHTGFQ